MDKVVENRVRKVLFKAGTHANMTLMSASEGDKGTLQAPCDECMGQKPLLMQGLQGRNNRMLGKEQPWKWREIHRIVERKPRCHGPKRAIPVPVYGLPIESGEGISMNYIEGI